MELIFGNDLNSAKLLDSIMNGYPGRNCGTVFADRTSMAVMLFFLERKLITVTECTYRYDPNIHGDKELMDLYTELARDTRWRRGTEIEGLRINALRVMREEGKPSYDGFICYHGGKVCVHCGNLELHPLLMYLAGHEQVETLYLFPYPYREEDDMAKYYRFAISGEAIEGTKAYRENMWQRLREATSGSGIFPPVPEDGASLR